MLHEQVAQRRRPKLVAIEVTRQLIGTLRLVFREAGTGVRAPRLRSLVQRQLRHARQVIDQSFPDIDAQDLGARPPR